MLIFGDVNGLKNWGFLGVLTVLVGDGAYLHLRLCTSSEDESATPPPQVKNPGFAAGQSVFLAKPKPPGFDRF